MSQNKIKLSVSNKLVEVGLDSYRTRSSIELETQLGVHVNLPSQQTVQQQGSGDAETNQTKATQQGPGQSMV